MTETMAEILYGITEEKYRVLTRAMVKQLEGKKEGEAMKSCIENIETDDRPLREKLVMAVMLGQISVL
jgi:hypothetical protein